jgi:ubiquinone/menaquinone biosynthesis C-methylase UbiE
MCELAASRSRALAHGQIDVVHASVEQLPFSAGAFDRVLCVHVVYFWSDLAAALREVARVTAPGGRWAFVLRTAAFRGAQDFPREVYRFPALEDVRAAVAGVGFSIDASGDEASDSLLLIAECARS